MKVTIITVVLNGELFLERAIKSVISQRYDDIEYIIIDGKSVDKTLDIIRKYKRNITTWISEKDNGVYDAMNKGIRLSKGDIVYFLNHDDFLIDENAIGDIVKRFEDNTVMVYGNIIQYNPNKDKDIIVYGKVTMNNIKDGTHPSHQAVFIRKYALESFNTRYHISADYDLLCKLYKKYEQNIVYIDRIIARFNHTGISAEYVPRFKDNAKIILEQFGLLRYIMYQRYILRYYRNILLKKSGLYALLK